MKIKLVYEAQLREAAGCSEADLQVNDGLSVAGLLQQVAAEQESLRPRLLGDDQHPLHSLLIFVNERPVEREAAARQSLTDGDTVLLLPPISGG